MPYLPQPFIHLSKPIQKALQEKGFSSPTEPQKKAIPMIEQGLNILLVAPTGTGKTEAAFLPVMDCMLKSPRSPGIKVLYITPLRALNRDLLERMEWWCKRLDVKLAIRHGDTTTQERSTQAAAPPDILITTPETLQAILPGKIMKDHLAHVAWVIVDEVHELASDKRGTQLALSLERLRLIIKKNFQVIGLSATIGSPETIAQLLVGTQRHCEIITVPVARSMTLEVIYPQAASPDYPLAEKLYTFPEVAARLRAVRSLIDRYQSVLIFTNTRSITEILVSRFKVWDINYPVGIHHGSLSRLSRVAAEKDFKGGALNGIVCTSSLELGIDVGSLSLVIQYNSPRQVSRLLQRVGRSGHQVGGTARGVIIVQDSDDALEAVVIARRSLHEELEEIIIPEKSFDVLIHQLIGMLLERRQWSFAEALLVIRGAYPYRDFSEADLIRVLDYLYNRHPRFAWFSPQKCVFARPRDIKPLYGYYFDTLSMIPDEKHFLVVEEIGEQPIGLLDEAFVSEYGVPGTKFVERGCLWKILYLYGDRIYVKAEDDPLGAIPSWAGEEIPVPFVIAHEVGVIRGVVEKGLQDGQSLDDIAENLIATQGYPCGVEMLVASLSEIAAHVKAGSPVPTDRRVTIERWGEHLILHCCFGLMVNRTLARLLGEILSERVGAAIGVHQDPYRILLKVPGVKPEDVRGILYDFADKDVSFLVEESLAKTMMFKRRFVHVARKAGAISKGANISTMALEGLITSFRDTAIFDEALRYSLYKDVDVAATQFILGEIARGEVEVVVIEGLSPIGGIGIGELERKCDLIPPQKMKKMILQYARARLLEEPLPLVCTQCWQYVDIKPVKEILIPLACPECGATQIGVLGSCDEGACRAVVREQGKGEKGDYARASANLIQSYGEAALLALAGNGITMEQIRDILSKEQEVTDTLIDAILEREKEMLMKRYPRRH